MRLITVSVLSMMVCGTAWANARLPVVNIGAGAVSARAAFGEQVGDTAPTITPVKENHSQSIVARAQPKAAPRAATVKKATPAPAIDSGEQMVAALAGGDILIPHRPSGDLWAKTEAPLRMPLANEFSVIRSDAPLPEESLDGRAPSLVARTDSQPVTPVASVRPASGALDKEIAKLVDAHRRDADVTMAAARPMPATVTGSSSPRRVVSRAGRSAPKTLDTARSATVSHNADSTITAAGPQVNMTPATPDTKSTALADGGTTVRRMVVPMTPDVVMRPAATASTDAAPKFASVASDMAKMSPTELKKAFRKTYLSENKHLSTFQIDDRFDVVSDMDTTSEGFTATHDLSEAGGVRPLEIKIKFRGDDASLSRENYNLLTEYASIVLANPKRAVQVSIPERATYDSASRKLAARRLAIVEQVLRDTGVSEHRIMPVLSARDEQGFVLRMISNDQFETLTQKKRDMFGDTVGKKTYTSMSW